MKSIELKEYEEITIKVRERAQAIELLNQGKTRIEVCKILGRTKKTISNWTISFKKYGIAGLFDEDLKCS